MMIAIVNKYSQVVCQSRCWHFPTGRQEDVSWYSDTSTWRHPDVLPAPGCWYSTPKCSPT